MPRRRILFADNNADFLTARAKFLAGRYQVRAVPTLQAAEQCLQDEWVHVAILDLRLVDDDDDRDVSGLLLARNEAYRCVPKIILTNYPSPSAVREALAPVVEGLPPAVDFLTKAEGAQALLEAVERVFTRYVRINWNLLIQTHTGEPMPFLHLVTRVEVGLTDDRLLHRAEELEDLFRWLFGEKTQIRLGRLLWQGPGRVAITVFAFGEAMVPESCVVVCGQHAGVIEERRRYNQFAPKAPGLTSTVLIAHAETTHFAANVYALAGADLEHVQPLDDLYRAGPEKAFTTAVQTLVQHTLPEWHQHQRVREDTRTLDEVYRQRLRWDQERCSQTAWDERVQALLQRSSTLGLPLERKAGRLVTQLHGSSLSYPDPTRPLYQAYDVGEPVLLLNTPGILSGSNVLADQSGRIWLTDFAEAGLAPLLWNVTTLEAIMRFDWIETHDLQARLEMEHGLLGSTFSQLALRDVDPTLRKPVRALQTLRRLSARLVGTDPKPYYLGMLFQTAHRLMEFNPTWHLTPHALARLTHIFIAAAMLCSKIEPGEQEQAAQGTPARTGLWIDKPNRTVWVEGIRVVLTGQSYDLLCDLYAHTGQLCTRRELVERVFQQGYDETDESQINRLNTAIRRLREKIEEDPSEPRYLRTEPGGGYRFVLQPY